MRFCTYNQEQPGAAAVVAAAAKAPAGEDAALLTWCMPSCSCSLALSSLAPSLHWSSGGATASSLVSAHSVHGSTRVNRCCSCSLRLEKQKAKL